MTREKRAAPHLRLVSDDDDDLSFLDIQLDTCPHCRGSGWATRDVLDAHKRSRGK